ncbi:MAG TPA: DUF4388 domain-containing protein [Acidimicrobiia bacterium]|jgi:hypothetical protein
MMLSGNLTDWSVGDLLQMLHITKKTASLHVTGTDRGGVVHFEEGAIVNADVSLGGGVGEHPRDEVIEAVYVLELLDEGTFDIKGEVPSRTVDPIPVTEALELAGKHLVAERNLDETGLLAARGLRLAQTIEEPIILSEQVWNAISASIPAFTFPELEARLGRAGAIATIEQFRDLGILEAVLEDLDPPVGHSEPEVVVPHAPEPAAIPHEPPAPDEAWTFDASVSLEADSQPSYDDSWSTPEQPEEALIVPEAVEEVRPIVAEAADDSIMVPVNDSPPTPVTESTGPSVGGVSSLSAAIRAAAEAGGVAEVVNSADDESKLLVEAAGDPAVGDSPSLADAAEGGSLRRTVRSLVSQPESALVTGALGDLSARFRQAAAASESDD